MDTLYQCYYKIYFIILLIFNQIMANDTKSGLFNKEIIIITSVAGGLIYAFVVRKFITQGTLKDSCIDLYKGKKLSEMNEINASQKTALFRELMKCYINNLENTKHIYYFLLPSMIRIDNNNIKVKIIGIYQIFIHQMNLNIERSKRRQKTVKIILIVYLSTLSFLLNLIVKI